MPEELTRDDLIVLHMLATNRAHDVHLHVEETKGTNPPQVVAEDKAYAQRLAPLAAKIDRLIEAQHVD